jgi:hypothetical protein
MTPNTSVAVLGDDRRNLLNTSGIVNADGIQEEMNQRNFKIPEVD